MKVGERDLEMEGRRCGWEGKSEKNKRCYVRVPPP